jgi:hypothetical protein
MLSSHHLIVRRIEAMTARSERWEARCHSGRPGAEEVEVFSAGALLLAVTVTPPSVLDVDDAMPMEADEEVEAELEATEEEEDAPDVDPLEEDAAAVEVPFDVAPGRAVPLGIPVLRPAADEVTSPAKAAKPTAAGDARKTVYVFLSSVSPTTH